LTCTISKLNQRLQDVIGLIVKAPIFPPHVPLPHTPRFLSSQESATMQFRVSVCDFLRCCAVERRLSDHTVRAYANDLADLRKFVGADATPAEISAAMLSGYIEDMLGRRKLAASSVRRRFACLRAFFRQRAEREGFADPCAALKLQLPRRKRLPRTLSRPEIASLMRSLARFAGPQAQDDATLATAVSLMVSTGIRVGELCKLSIDDVSPDGATCRIFGKGSRDRVVYISDVPLRRELHTPVNERRHRANGHTALFLNRHGAPMKPQSIRSRLRRYARQIGLSRRVTPHMLRHTAATLLIETGVDIRFVQRLLGHSSIATTEIYTHVSDEALRTTLARANILASLSR
jgi:integrase/recombinase XerD